MYHFIGILGSGMSSLAIVMKKLGFDVQGSDYDKHFFTMDELIENGISVFPFSEDNIKDDMIIVKGNSFDSSNVEVACAVSKNLKIYTYQEMVHFITRSYDLIAIAGCHGKTTTSKLLSHVMDSNYLIGDGSGGVSSSEYFVLEACEYRRHFLSYHPKISVITNIDFDHVDYFKDIDDVFLAYQEFINGSQIVIGCGDNSYVRKLRGVNYLYGVNDYNDFQAVNVSYSITGISFDFKTCDGIIKSFDVPFYGKHMLLNTLAVISVCYIEGYDLSKVQDLLVSFGGAKRRFNEYFVLDNVVIDDYAHHPSEIRSVIDAVRQKYPDKKIISIFEPHTFSRTLEFYKDIAFELNKCDYSFVMDIYSSREDPCDFDGVTSDVILRCLNGEYITRGDVFKLLDFHDSVLIFMSPNDLSGFINDYIEKYKI